MYWAISAVCKYNPEVVSGYTIYNDTKKTATYVDNNDVVTFLRAGNKIENMAIGINRLVGTMGSLDRLTRIDRLGMPLTNETYIIISYNGGKNIQDRVYRVVNCFGSEAYLSLKELLDFGKANIICNGKIVTHKNGTQYIAPICGKFRVVKGVKYNKNIGHGDKSYVKKFRMPDNTINNIALKARPFPVEEFYNQYLDTFKLANDKQRVFKRVQGIKDYGGCFQDIFIYKVDNYEIEFDIFEIEHNLGTMIVVKSLSKTFIVHDILHIGRKYTRLLRRGDDNSTDSKIVMLGMLGVIVINGIISFKSNRKLMDIRVIPYINLLDNIQNKLRDVGVTLDESDINRIKYIAGKWAIDVSYRPFSSNDLSTFTSKISSIRDQERFGIISVRKVAINKRVNELKLQVNDNILGIAYANELRCIDVPGELGIVSSNTILDSEFVTHCEVSLAPHSFNTIGSISVNNIDIQYIAIFAAYNSKIINDISVLSLDDRQIGWLNAHVNLVKSPSNTVVFELCGTVYEFSTSKLMKIYNTELEYITKNSGNIQLLLNKLSLMGIDDIQIDGGGYITNWGRIDREIKLPRYIRGIRCEENNWKALKVRPNSFLNVIYETDGSIPYQSKSNAYTKITMVYDRNTLDLMEKQLTTSFKESKVYNKYIFDAENASIDDIDRVVALGELEILISLSKNGIILNKISIDKISKFRLVNIIAAMLLYRMTTFEFSLEQAISLRNTEIKIRPGNIYPTIALNTVDDTIPILEKYFLTCTNELLSKLKIGNKEFSLLADAINSILSETNEHNGVRDNIIEKCRYLIK